jgi:energy-coupling factor transport system ATP-binding protein
MGTLIEIVQLSYEYPVSALPTQAALSDISLRIDEGGWVALVGANGSGKTALARHINGLLLPTRGIMRVAGMDTRQREQLKQIRSMVGMVFQSPEEQVIATTVEEDVAFGAENLCLPEEEIRQRVEEALHRMGLWEERQRPPHLLSAGQMQRLALAGVLVMQPRAIVFDEATTMLDPIGRRSAMDMLRQLHDQGITIIFITHHMDEAAQAGRLIALDHGRVAWDGTPQDFFAQSGLVERLGLEQPPAARAANRLRVVFPGLPDNLLLEEQLLASLPAPHRIEHLILQDKPVFDPSPTEPGLIDVQALEHIYLQDTPLARLALENASLQVAPCHAHALAGATGSGKSTLLQHLNGVLRPQKGTVRVGPYDLSDPKLNGKEVCQLAGLVFQNPELQFFEQFVGDEIAYGPRQMGLKTGIAQRVQWAMEQVGLDFEAYKDRMTYTLSGGEKRKVALASILAIKPEILLLDEPTGGLDPRSRREILERLGQLKSEGMTLVFSSHQMEDVAQLADEMTVMQHGETAASGKVTDVFYQADLLAASGLFPPLAVSISQSLSQKGWGVPGGITHLDDLLPVLQRQGATA